MSLKILRDRLLAEHHHSPQLGVRINQAVSEIEAGLQTLAGMGHPFHLEAGAAPPEDDDNSWPRIYFHQDKSPNGRVVLSRWELAELGPGWWPTAGEAQHDDGMKTQFEGRGGVRKGTALMVIQANMNMKDL